MQHSLSVLLTVFWLRSLVWPIDRGDVRGPGSTAPSSAFKRVVVWRRNGCTMLTGSHTFVHGVGDNVIPRSSFLHVLALDAEPLGPNTSLFSYSTLFPCYRLLLVGPKSNLLSPSEEVSEVNDSEFISQNSTFYRPNYVSDWSVIHHMSDTSLLVT